MIKLPNFQKSFEYENNFYLSCPSSRIAKMLSHYELYKMTSGIQGSIVECGIFKGASLSRFAIFREIFGDKISKKIIGFDTFGKFPETKFTPDKKMRNKFIKEAGNQSISKNQMLKVLKHRDLEKKIDLVQGDITKTVPKYVKDHPKLKLSLLNLDTDVYEPAVTILKYLYPLITKGGVLILDDYGVFPGETKAVKEYFKGKKIKIEKFQSSSLHYVIKK